MKVLVRIHSQYMTLVVQYMTLLVLYVTCGVQGVAPEVLIKYGFTMPPCPLVQSTGVHKPITVHAAIHACTVRVHTAQWLHLQVYLYITTYPQVISMSRPELLL